MLISRNFKRLNLFRFCYAKKQQEWASIASQKNQEQLEYLEKILSQEQKQRVQLIADACLELDPYEFQCLVSQMHEQSFQTSGVGLCDLNPQWPVFKAADAQTWPPQTADQVQNYLKEIFGEDQPDFKSIFGGGSISVGGGASQSNEKADGKAQQAEEAKEQKEKTNFDIELSAIDPAQKIKIIKEVRQLLNLGLKEAKDTVEKLPAILGKQQEKEKAEELKEKLTALGCTINLL